MTLAGTIIESLMKKINIIETSYQPIIPGSESLSMFSDLSLQENNSTLGEPNQIGVLYKLKNSLMRRRKYKAS